MKKSLSKNDGKPSIIGNSYVELNSIPKDGDSVILKYDSNSIYVTSIKKINSGSYIGIIKTLPSSEDDSNEYTIGQNIEFRYENIFTLYVK